MVLPVFLTLFVELLLDGVECDRVDSGANDNVDVGCGDICGGRGGRRYATRFLFLDQEVSALKH